MGHSGAGVKAFCDLSATRPVTPAGPGPIPFAEVEARSRLTRCPLEPHHVRCLRALDETFLDHCRRRLAAGAGREIADVCVRCSVSCDSAAGPRWRASPHTARHTLVTKAQGQLGIAGAVVGHKKSFTVTGRNYTHSRPTSSSRPPPP